MAIQTRRGSYNDFDPEKLLPGEWAAVQSDDPASTDGQSIYMCFAPGQTKRMATYEDMVQNVDNSVEDVKNQFASGMQAATEAANTAATSATEATDVANSAADRAQGISDEIQSAIEGTLINDMSPSSLTVYSSEKVEADFRKKADIIDILHGGTGADTVEKALENLELLAVAGTVMSLGNVISCGYVTSNATIFQCTITLPQIIGTYSTISLSGKCKIRQSGAYILGGSSEIVSLPIGTKIIPNTGTNTAILEINSGLQEASNNTVAAAYFEGLTINFS